MLLKNARIFYVTYEDYYFIISFIMQMPCMKERALTVL